MKKLLMITWDMWQFQNGIVHSTAGPDAITHLVCLDCKIEYKFNEGTSTLFPSDHYFLQDYSPFHVWVLPLVTKQNWVASLQDVRCVFVMAGQSAVTNTLHCHFQQPNKR